MELRSILTTTKVGEITLSTRPALKPTDKVSLAAEEMRNVSHGCVLVIDNDTKLVGIFTERDLLKVIATMGTVDVPLADVMTPQPQTITDEATLFEATQLMDEGGYRRLPVIDASNVAVGIVDVKTITHFLVGHFPNTIYSQASEAEVASKNREGA